MTDPVSFDSHDLVRRATAVLGAARVFELIDPAVLTPQTGVPPLVSLSLITLRKNRSFETWLSKAPVAATGFVASQLTHDALDRAIDLLGDAAANPSYEELVSALEQMRAEFDPAVLAAMLALVAAESAPAEPHCRRLLAERPEFALPDVASAQRTSLVNEKNVDPEVREQRRARREAERVAKQSRSERVAGTPARMAKKKVVAPRAEPTAPTASTPAPLTPRKCILTPAEAAAVSVEHALVGSIIEMVVNYDARDSANPTETSKARPVLVMAASESSVLVRAMYSEEREDRQLLPGWRQGGLDHPSFISSERVLLSATAATGVRFGRLPVDAWNLIL